MVLEVGTELGSLLELGGNTYGPDITSTRGTNKLGGDAQNMPFGDSTLEALVVGELIEHLDTPNAFVAECFRVLRPGGSVVLTAPNRRGWLNRSTGLLDHDHARRRRLPGRPTVRDGFKRLVGYCAGSPSEYTAELRHKELFDEGQLVATCVSSGLQIEEIAYCAYGGWPGIVGGTVSIVRSIAHRCVPRGLREGIIVVRTKQRT